MRCRFLIVLLVVVAQAGSLGIGRQGRVLGEVSAQSLRKAVAGQKGKVVFVNFWATWCGPCVAEFPNIVKLYQKYHANGLEVIAVSFDETAPTAIPFLDKQKASFINFLKDPKQEAEVFMKDFDPQCVGALPASWLFDQAGKQRFFRMGAFDPAALDKQIAELLSRK